MLNNYMQARQGRGEIRQERQDTVPPLRRDNFRQTERSQQDRESSESRQRGRDRSTPRGTRASTPARASASASGSTPPWREDRGRQRSATPQGRRTLARATPGEHIGPTLAINSTSNNSIISQLKVQQYGQQRPREPYQSRHHGQSYYQQPYYRYNQRNSSVEYVPGDQLPYERWHRHADGTWIDMVPQFPEDSIEETK